MSMLIGAVWGFLTFAAMAVTVRYYLPQLRKRTSALTAEAPADSGEAKPAGDSLPVQAGCHRKILNHRGLTALMLTACALLAAWCGSSAAVHSVNPIGLVKLTVVMGVLSCTFITDLELMIIPNLCSLILLGARGITVICEFIWMRESAMSGLIDSLIAAVVSFVLLLFMARVTKGGLGLGDVKIFSCLGCLCGMRAVFMTLMLAFLICALISTALILIGRKGLRDEVPLGPCIWAGYCVCVLLSII